MITFSLSVVELIEENNRLLRTQISWLKYIGSVIVMSRAQALQYDAPEVIEKVELPVPVKVEE